MNTHKKTFETKLGTKMILARWLVVLCITLSSTTLFAQTKEWKTAKVGKISVTYNISERVDENDQTLPLIEYVATTTEEVSMQNCISLMKDPSKHKDFMDDKLSERIPTTSDDEWLIYNYTDASPFPSSDAVSKMTISEDAAAKTTGFQLTAVPSEYKKSKVKRMAYSKVTYTFKNLGNGKVEITVNAKMSPPIPVSGWMLNMAFPGAAADVVRKFMKLAKK